MAKSDKQFEGVEVEIFGQSYRIGGEPEKIQPAAEYVDRIMREIAENHKARLPALQVAILAAMEVAAEFLSLDKERQEFRRQGQREHSSPDAEGGRTRRHSRRRK